MTMTGPGPEWRYRSDVSIHHGELFLDGTYNEYLRGASVNHANMCLSLDCVTKSRYHLM
jgi:hypothetical protein